MEKEIWKDIEGYEGLYKVSNIGRVKSVERMKWNGKGYHKIPERILKAGDNGKGYLYITLCKDGTRKNYTVHQLVGNAFLSNPQGYKELNHIDEDKTNNRADNLEWCSRSYNNTYNGKAKKVAEKLSKPVIAIDVRTGLILEFASSREAERETGIPHSSIIQCCKGKMNSARGFYWMYAIK